MSQSPIPHVLIWNKVVRKGFLLDVEYKLIREEVVDTDIIVSSSIVEDYRFFPGFWDQVPPWVDDLLVSDTELVFPKNREDWIAYFFLC